MSLSVDGGLSWSAIAPLATGGVAAVAALPDGGTWASWFGSNGIPIVSNAVPSACLGTAHAIGVDPAQNTILALQVSGSTTVQICAFNLASGDLGYQVLYLGGLGTVQVSDLTVLGTTVEVVFWDNAGLHLGVSNSTAANTINLPDTDFTAEPVNGCYPAQLSASTNDAYLVEVCYSSGFGYEVAPMRAFTATGQPFGGVVGTVPISSNVSSLVAQGLAMDPGTFAEGPNAWIVGQSSTNGGFMAHYVSFGTTPTLDWAFDESSSALDAIGFAPDGGTFAVLADDQGAMQVRTYTALPFTDTDAILAAGGQASPAVGNPVPLWPSGAGSGHALAWADDQTVFFITSEGLFKWRPYGP